jgi:hypothetical protein
LLSDLVLAFPLILVARLAGESDSFPAVAPVFAALPVAVSAFGLGLVPAVVALREAAAVSAPAAVLVVAALFAAVFVSVPVAVLTGVAPHVAACASLAVVAPAATAPRAAVFFSVPAAALGVAPVSVSVLVVPAVHFADLLVVFPSFFPS